MKLALALIAAATLAACAQDGGPVIVQGTAAVPRTIGPNALPPGGPFHAPAQANAHVRPRSDGLQLGRQSVVVFVGPNCAFCDAAVADTRALSAVPVEVMDASTPHGRQQLAMLGAGTMLPVVVANHAILVGYDRRLLQQALGGMRETNGTQM